MRIGVVAGEESGDILGANLLIALKKRFPNAVFEGIGGSRMQALGFNSIYPLERLSVMGLIEPLKRLPEILSIRKGIIKHFIQNKPDVFIGIDAPDFNLSLEKTLKKNGIKTVHYVSPTVWAWRKGRVKTIKKAVDLVLALFPFETKIYEKNAIPVCFVGHSLADTIPLFSDKSVARKELNLPSVGKIVALLPGSRKQELHYLAIPFIETAIWLKERDPSITFISACANDERKAQFEELILKHEKCPPITLFNGQATQVMAAADCVLLASGTASLQSMLVKRPTVIAYKMSPWVFALAKWLVKVPYIGLPNLLADKLLMPEFIQSDVVPANMGQQLLAYLNAADDNQALTATYEEIHHLLRKNAGETAASAILSLLNR
ncbi:MAG: lipid-A-disaccharide synthase [Proteobacteria bacterium]|nr:lipid-A-disaccharide synthase [Pseudomonadota bacterium]